ncbi:unnamed protein product [Choristocarpus tenellus]
MVCAELKRRNEEACVLRRTSSCSSNNSLTDATEYAPHMATKKNVTLQMPDPQCVLPVDMPTVHYVDPRNEVEDEDFGWFSDTGDTDGLSDTDGDVPPPPTSVENVQQRHRDSIEGKEACSVAVTGAEVEFRAHNRKFALSTKCFYEDEIAISATTWTWGIGGFRIVKSKQGRYADFQIVASYGGRLSWSVWKRFSDFSAFAGRIQSVGSRSGKTAASWGRVRRGQKIFRCLDPVYLKSKCILLEDFVRHALFETTDPSVLIAFVTQERRY